MKKFLSLFLLLSVTMLLSVSAFAAGSSEITFDSYSSGNGENMVVDVNISEGGKPCMLQYCVSYDPEVVECVSVNVGDAFSGTSAPLVNQTEGKIYFIWDSLRPLNNGGTMMSIEFAPKNEASTEVKIDETESFVVANSKFEDVGTINGKAELVFEKEQSKPESSEQTSSENTSSKAESSESSSASSESSSKTESSGSSSNVPESSQASSSRPEYSEGTNNGITIDKNQAFVGIEEEIEVEITEGEKENVVWYSSNENVAKVEDGKVVPVSPGTAIITVTTEDGTEEATCVVTVTEEATSSGSELENIEVGALEREEKNKMPFWAYAVIAVIVAAIAVVAFMIYKKAKK